MVELYLHSPIRLHGLALNDLSTGITLPSYLYGHVTKELIGGWRNYHYEVLHILNSSPSKLLLE
jgi:hypothetical protein